MTATEIRPLEPAAPADDPALGPDSADLWQRGPDEVVNKRSSIAFFVVHLMPLLVFVTGITTTAVVLFFVTYFGRGFFITAGYHRYFAHRSYKLGRVAQFVMAFGACSAAQKGPLWWAGHHRAHHRNSDTPLDIHSPKRGFWWSHVGWILCDKYNATPEHDIKDFARYPELRWLNKHDWVGPWSLGVAWAAAILQMVALRDLQLYDAAVLGVLYSTAAHAGRIVKWAGLASAGVGAVVRGCAPVRAGSLVDARRARHCVP